MNRILNAGAFWKRGKSQQKEASDDPNTVFCLYATGTVTKGLAGLAQNAAKRFKTRQTKRKL
jgi:hypothetical protein